MAAPLASQVLRLPAVKQPKHYKEAYNLIRDTHAKFKAALPPVSHKFRSKEEFLSAAKTSPFPDVQQMAHNKEKADQNLVSALTYVPPLLRKDQIFPVALWKKVLPPVFVDSYAEHLVKQYKDAYEKSDVLPLAKEYSAFLNEQVLHHHTPSYHQHPRDIPPIRAFPPFYSPAFTIYLPTITPTSLPTSSTYNTSSTSHTPPTHSTFTPHSTSTHSCQPSSNHLTPSSTTPPQ